MTRDKKRSGTLEEWISRGLLLVSLLYVGWLIQNFEVCWFQPEMTRIHLRVGQIGAHFKVSDLLHLFDFAAWEWAPRTSRPIASAFDILDARWRMGLAQLGLIHPSFSLSWIFVFFCSPWLLLRLLRGRGVKDPTTRNLVLVLYLLSTSTLCLVTMYFRSAKALATASILFALYLAQALQQRQRNGPVPTKVWIRFWLLQLALYLVDETATLSFAFILLLFPGLFPKKRLFFFWMLIPAYIFLITVGIPAVAKAVGYPWENPFLFRPTYSLTRIVASFELLPRNTWVLLRESLCLFGPAEWAPLGKWGLLGILPWLGILFCAILFFRRKKVGSGTPFDSRRLLYLLLLLCCCHATLMRSTDNGVWGNYWYGTYLLIGLLFCVANLAHTLPRWALLIWVALWMPAQMVQYPALNQVYRDAHYLPYDPPIIGQVFRAERSRFSFVARGSRKELTRAFLGWEKSHAPESLFLPMDLFYLPVEKGLYRDARIDAASLGSAGFQSFRIFHSGHLVPYLDAF